MLELNPKTLTKAKIVNVTEARANFAAILSDTKSDYIITKNGRPQRVIISFEDFQKLQEGTRPEGVAIPVEPLSEALPVADEPMATMAERAEAAAETGAKRAKPQPGIKGIIAAQFEMAQPLANEPAPPEEAFCLDQVQPLRPEEKLIVAERASPLSEISATLEDVEMNNETGGADDFSTAEGNYFAEGVEAAGAEATSEDTHESAGTQLSAGDSRDPSSAEAAPEPALPAGRTAEEEEYFKRYRKLYEDQNWLADFTPSVDIPLPEPTLPEKVAAPDVADSAAPAEAEPIAVAPMVASEPVYFELSEVEKEARYLVAHDLSLAEEDPIPLDDEVPLEAVETNFDLQPATAPVPEKVWVAEPLPAGDASQASPGTTMTSEESALPSLTDLLRDLERQRLSDEDDGTLDSRDIDELINRITSD